jgi:hypothetical protein
MYEEYYYQVGHPIYLAAQGCFDNLNEAWAPRGDTPAELPSLDELSHTVTSQMFKRALRRQESTSSVTQSLVTFSAEYAEAVVKTIYQQTAALRSMLTLHAICM